jgi:hypothetical protein
MNFDKIFGKFMNKYLISAKSKFAIFFGLFSIGLMLMYDSIFYELNLLKFSAGFIMFVSSIFIGRFFIKSL